AVFNHAAALRADHGRIPGGALVCFSGGDRADQQFKASDNEIKELYRRDLIALFPQLDGNIDDDIVIRRHHRVVPYWSPGDRSTVRSLRASLGPVHFAGDYLLGVPSLADAAASGERAAREVLDRLANRLGDNGTHPPLGYQ